MTKILLSLLAVVLLLYGCSFIAKTVYGARKPKVETEQSIINWLNDNKLPTEEVASLDTSEYLNFLPLFTTSPLLFEGSGKFRAAGYSNGKFCPNNVDQYLSRVNPQLNTLNTLDSFIVRDAYNFIANNDQLDKMEKKEFNELKKKVVPAKDTIRPNFFDLNNTFYSLNGIKYRMINPKGYDFILILPFAKFFGHNFQAKDLRNYYQAAVNNPNAKFKIIFLNLDKQGWWGKEANDRININI